VTYRELDLARGTTRVEWNADAWWGTQAEGEVESRWRLSGGEWSNWSRKRELLFEDLAVGEHHLEIEAKALLGQRAPPTRLDFEVLAPLHARPEVLVPTALVLVTAAGWLGFGAWRRRSFAREIARREQRFSEILDNVDDVIFTANLDGRLTSLNRAGMELAAHAATDAAAIDWETLLNPASRDRAAEALRQKQADGRSAAYEIECSGADGRAHVLEVHSRLVRSQGRPPEIQGVARDVTERRRLESQLHHAQKMESLGLLAGGVAHDFNNLLLSILGNLDLARGAWRDGRSPSQALDDLEIAAERATDLARVMLAYSGRARFEIRPLDFTELTGEILRLLRASLPSTVRFDTDLPDSLPAIEGDRAQIQQVILNLVTNAADAIGDEDGTISVRTGAGAAAECRLGQPALDADFGDGSVSWLQVTDSGPGIDATTLERIFDPFFTTKGAGRGLGLSAVLGIVRSHGGALDVRSTPGRGTSFRMLFPALTGPAPPEPQVEPARRKGLSGSRVLVVDDEDRVREMVGRLLKRSGCEVLTARDGLEAQGVVRAEAGRLDAVLLDLVMPRCSGEQALVAIREMAPDLPVVLTSGFTEQEVSARHVGRGPTSFLGKPYRLADLEAAFSAAFGALERSEPEDGSDGSQ
jgi:PAS domain S-box-containing protein